MAVDIADSSFTNAAPAGSGVYPIPLVRAAVTGFIGRTERGPISEPITVRSFADFFQQFGGHLPDSFLSHAVQDYFLHGGAIAVVVRVVNRATRAEIECPAGDSSLVLSARYPGKHEKIRVSIDYDGIQVSDHQFNLVAQRLRNSGSSLIADQELFPRISINPTDERFIVDALSDSKLIRVTGSLPSVRPDSTPPERPGAATRYIETSRAGSDGDVLSDYDIIGSNKAGTGLFSFAHGPRIDFLCIPPSPTRDVGMTAFLAAERVCAETRAIYICDPPMAWSNVDQAIIGSRAMPSQSRNVLAYYPRIRPRGERARFELGLPACGAIAGMLALRESRGVWQPDCPLILKNSLMAAVELTATNATLLQRVGINTFFRGASGQTALRGNVTLGSAASSSGQRGHLDRRRLYSYILASIEDAVGFALSHYAENETAHGLAQNVGNFLAALHSRTALVGDSPAQAFFVQLKPGNSPTEPVVLRFGVALHKPGEFIEASVPIAPGRVPVAKRSYGIEAQQLFN
jgi:hypothetical protein